MKKILLAAIALSAALILAQTKPPYGTLVKKDPRFDRLLPPGSVIEKLDDGHAWSEGPVWNRQQGFLLWSDIPKNSIFKWTPGPDGNGPGTVTLFLSPSGYTGTAPFTGPEPGSNGLTYDSDRKSTRL